MATHIKTMKDINGNTVLPRTNINAIYDDSRNRDVHLNLIDKIKESNIHD